MRQIVQNLRTGATSLIQLPVPVPQKGQVLIRTEATVVSQGTEKMLVQFAKASLFQKARSQPDRVRQVMSKMRVDGILPTLESVFRRLDEPLPLGYCNAGIVVELGEGVTEFAVGDRVASNGAHAEFVAVPANLVAFIPNGVSALEAAFTPIAAVALQSIRLLAPELGETVAVIGLGLVGQLAAQLLRAHGCRVVGYDFDAAKAKLASDLGADALAVGPDSNVLDHAARSTGGVGVDAVLIAASTSSDEVVAQAARMCRKRGRVVLVGVVGLNLNRADFYAKEITFQVSCSYGPGLYEDQYENKGCDYPIGYVRWTENRNFQAVLLAMQSRSLLVRPLVTKQFLLDDYASVYENMSEGLASVLLYSPKSELKREIYLGPSSFSGTHGALGIFGAGNFVKMTILPALARADANVKAIVSAGGLKGTGLAAKYKIPISGSDPVTILADPEIGGVIIATRHDSHFELAIAALNAGKHVLVEKPLCLTLEQLGKVTACVAALPQGGPTLTVGFNRRFSPGVEKMRTLITAACGREAISVIATMNAGSVPSDHWVHDPEVGGGRILGEACHLVDLAIFLTGSLVIEVSAAKLGPDPLSDSAAILLRHENGSTSSINYFSTGSRLVSKERVEVHFGGKTLLLDNFRVLRGYGFKSFTTLKTGQDKGHPRQFALFAQRVLAGGAPLIPFQEIMNATRATFAAVGALSSDAWIKIPNF